MTLARPFAGPAVLLALTVAFYWKLTLTDQYIWFDHPDQSYLELPRMQFQARGPQGVMSVTVAAVDGEEVTIDANHPLAGQNLNFAIEVVSVREATAEELAHGHIHGPGGHHH